MTECSTSELWYRDDDTDISRTSRANHRRFSSKQASNTAAFLSDIGRHTCWARCGSKHSEINVMLYCARTVPKGWFKNAYKLVNLVDFKYTSQRRADTNSLLDMARFACAHPASQVEVPRGQSPLSTEGCATSIALAQWCLKIQQGNKVRSSFFNKLHIFQCMGKILMWNFKGYLWNSTQNIWSIHWKWWFLYNVKYLRALKFTGTHTHTHKNWLDDANNHMGAVDLLNLELVRGLEIKINLPLAQAIN